MKCQRCISRREKAYEFQNRKKDHFLQTAQGRAVRQCVEDWTFPSYGHMLRGQKREMLVIEQFIDQKIRDILGNCVAKSMKSMDCLPEIDRGELPLDQSYLILEPGVVEDDLVSRIENLFRSPAVVLECPSHSEEPSEDNQEENSSLSSAATAESFTEFAAVKNPFRKLVSKAIREENFDFDENIPSITNGNKSYLYNEGKSANNADNHVDGNVQEEEGTADINVSKNKSFETNCSYDESAISTGEEQIETASRDKCEGNENKPIPGKSAVFSKQSKSKKMSTGRRMKKKIVTVEEKMEVLQGSTVLELFEDYLKSCGDTELKSNEILNICKST